MQARDRWYALVSCTVIAACVPAIAAANAGVPMLAVAWPLSWIALLPIIAIEAWIGRGMLDGLSWGRAFGAAGLANAVSTFVGIPMTWALLLGVQWLLPNGGGAEYGIDTLGGKLFAVTAQAPWLIPWDTDLHWMVPAALLFMLPFFGIVSVYVERPLFRLITKCDGVVARRWSWRANLTTYGVMIASTVIWLVVAVIVGGR